MKVKALEWRKGYCDEQVTISQAYGFGGAYQVRSLNGVIWLDQPLVREETIYPSIEAAKQAAQHDYESRILSAIEDV